MKIAIGSDHRGYSQKNKIIQQITDIEWIDVGCFSPERCDYPKYAKLVVNVIREKKADLGVLLCGSGIGMAIAANRFKGMYAGLVWSVPVAIKAREDDNVNIVVLPSDFISDKESILIIKAWLQAKFKGGRYQERLSMIDEF